MKNDKTTTPAIKFRVGVHIATPAFPPTTAEGKLSLTRDTEELLANDPVWVEELWKQLKKEFLLNAAALELLAERAERQRDAEAASAEQRRKANTSASHKRWCETKTDTPSENIGFLVRTFTAATWRLGRRDLQSDGGLITSTSAPRVDLDNVRHVADYLLTHARQGHFLWSIPESLGCTVLAVEDDCSLWPKFAERFAFPPTLTWHCNSGTPTTYYLWRGQQGPVVKGDDFIIVPGMKLLRRAFVPLPTCNADGMCSWTVTPSAFGKTLTGDQVDLPSLPDAFAESVRSVALTELNFRTKFYGLMFEAKPVQ